MHKFTKIVATISDKRCDVAFIKTLFEAGVNVVRMNSAHLDYEGFKKIVTNVRAADDRLAIMMDTKGPEVRTTVTVDDTPVSFKAGDKVYISGNPEGKTSHEEIFMNYPSIVRVLKPGDRVLIDDGEVEFIVKAISENKALAEAQRWRTRFAQERQPARSHH